MRWVTSRRFVLPESPKEMRDEIWFNLWKVRNRPFSNLKPGDDLLWYESPTKHLRWKTKVRSVDAFQYSSKAEVAARLKLDEVDQLGSYFADGPSHGYCLAYGVEPIEHLAVPKKKGFRFPGLGWMELEYGIDWPWEATKTKLHGPRRKKDQGWSNHEIAATVTAYFEMLEQEMMVQPFNKAEYNRQLRQGPLHARSKGAVELKLANISFVLANNGIPWVKGYKPRKNIQKALIPTVLAEAETRGLMIQFFDRKPTADPDVLASRVRKLKGHLKSKPSGVKQPAPAPEGGHRGFMRSPEVVSWVYGLAKGMCELCEQPAPFEDRHGDPYLECHHVQWLGKGGADTTENAVAVCPNCHRLLHSGAERVEAKEKLYGQVERLERE